MILGVLRFAYALTASPQGWTGTTYMETVYQLHLDQSATLKRRWGPLFVGAMDGYSRLPLALRTKRALTRAALTAAYAVTLWLLALTIADRTRQWLVVGLGLQSTAAIYAISNGMGEIVSALCVVVHFWAFLQRRYWLAALAIVVGIYFKLYPAVFAFPFFVFASMSREHRRYCGAVIVSTAAIATVSLAFGGWRNGFLYPVSMVGSVVSDAELIPILSKEVFGPMSLAGRVMSGFRVHPVDAATLALARRVTSVFTVLLVATTATAAVGLAWTEQRWRGSVNARPTAAVIFQSTIGFLMFAFSPDDSITLLLPIVVSMYAPLWFGMSPLVVLVFVAGSVLAGNLVPLSLVLRVVPLTWLDRIAGNPPAAMIPHEKFMWYELPMVGVALLALAFVLSVMRDDRWPHSPDSRTAAS
ncbi:MAG TPA: glycosyltransferase 87 family protein [Vicinamibacterales bacterium]|nr:glycosyltransferase 87 family protein [Vicinamibacterales bacterium]